LNELSTWYVKQVISGDAAISLYIENTVGFNM